MAKGKRRWKKERYHGNFSSRSPALSFDLCSSRTSMLSSNFNPKKNWNGKGKCCPSQGAGEQDKVALHCSSRLVSLVRLHHHVVVVVDPEAGEEGGGGEVSGKQPREGDRQDERPVPGEEHWQHPQVWVDVGKEEEREEDDPDKSQE